MKPRFVWILALAVTLASAVYQRLTGPTHPVRGSKAVGGELISYRLIRSHGGEGDAEIRVAASPLTEGTIAWRRFKTDDKLTYTPMVRDGQDLVGRLPHQPPAGKLEYRVILQREGERVWLTGPPVVIRFKGAVPITVLSVHVFAMFTAMLLSNRVGLGVLLAKEQPGVQLVGWTLLLLTIGGMILGPVVQEYAFGAYWTGWPFGTDLTDNKTAVAWVAWILAWAAVRRNWTRPWIWMLVAALATLAVYLIPHSMFGSELKYG